MCIPITKAHCFVFMKRKTSLSHKRPTPRPTIFDKFSRLSLNESILFFIMNDKSLKHSSSNKRPTPRPILFDKFRFLRLNEHDVLTYMMYCINTALKLCIHWDPDSLIQTHNSDKSPKYVMLYVLFIIKYSKTRSIQLDIIIIWMLHQTILLLHIFYIQLILYLFF